MAATTGPVRALWTDYGGVLTPPTAESMESFCARLGVPSAPLLAAMRQVSRDCGAGEDIMAPLDTPLLTQESWERRVEAALATHSGIRVDLSDYPARWFADRAVNQPWLDTLHRLRRQGVFVGLLSNMPPAWDRHWRLAVPPEGLFDAVVLSYNSGCRKPEEEIFRLAAERAGVRPEECVLVDDLAVNCAGAEQAGWHGVEFTGAEAATARVDALTAPGSALVPVDPDREHLRGPRHAPVTVVAPGGDL
ncbi:HAD family hydrolase [Streptomyces sp. NBC_00564]|uniref:HAD family hydrolase n=1 Tax=Streptomyces sp. NBC_00564 TaxID=2903663 RepID=UPI00352E06AE|nr:HAD family phosphatase [Streptomyces sp. NBC_00564]